MAALNAQTAAITGAASGIGLALAELLAQKGFSLALADINADALDQLADKLRSGGCSVSVHPLDVADRQAVEQFAGDAAAFHGRIDMLFNNAGVALSETVEQVSYDDFEWIMGINFWGVVYGTKAFLPIMRRQNGGHIVNISSIFGIIGVPTQSAYNASKFAVKGFTEALRQELASSPIKVSCVHPGGIKTNIARNARFYTDMNGGKDVQQAISGFDKLAKTDAATAAKVIMEGVEGNRKRILIGSDAKFLDLIQRLMPASYERILARLTKSS